MPSNQTTNYQLSQWVKSDQVKMEDFNADNAKIDEVLGEHAEKLAGCGNCSVETFSYSGVGTIGDGKVRRLNFSKRPMFFMITGGSSATILWANGTCNYGVFYGRTHSSTSAFMGAPRIIWSGPSAILDDSDPIPRMDTNGETYYVVAFLDVTQ